MLTKDDMVSYQTIVLNKRVLPTLTTDKWPANHSHSHMTTLSMLPPFRSFPLFRPHRFIFKVPVVPRPRVAAAHSEIWTSPFAGFSGEKVHIFITVCCNLDKEANSPTNKNKHTLL